jgi:hypothetical protein
MNSNNTLLLLITFLFFSCGNSPKGNKKKVADTTGRKKVMIETIKPGCVSATELFKGSKTPYDEAMGKSGDTIFHCSYKGEFSFTDTASKKNTFLFDIKAEYMIDKIFIIALPENKWFLSWQETDHEGVKSYSAVYKTGAIKPEWKLTFKVPNPGPPILDGTDAYVTYLGIAGKLSIGDGKFAWKYDSLFNTNKEPFKQFEKPRIFENKIEFVDLPIPGRRERRDTLRVDPVTGKRIR